MALAYSEFATTQANLLADLRTAILASSDWTRPNSATFPSLYKATTTRGAVMAFNLEQTVSQLNGLSVGVFRNHDGTTGTDLIMRYLFWKGGTGGITSATPIYCTVSASKEHIYIGIEGPRAADVGAQSTAYGSARIYFSLSDLVPYHAADTTPAVVCAGFPQNSPYATMQNLYHQVLVSRNSANNSSWNPGKLMSLDFPSCYGGETAQSTRPCTIDGNYYLTPYVYFDDTEGIRGRLSSIFFGGFNTSDTFDSAPPPLGSKVTYNGGTYKIIAANKGDVNGHIWGPLGSAANSNTGSAYTRSVVIGIPST